MPNGQGRTWSTKKKDSAPRGLFKHASGGWAIRFKCGRGCYHQEPVGEKSKALRVYHQRRSRALSEPGWCPKLDQRAAHAQGRPVKAYSETWLAPPTHGLQPRTHD